MAHAVRMQKKKKTVFAVLYGNVRGVSRGRAGCPGCITMMLERSEIDFGGCRRSVGGFGATRRL